MKCISKSMERNKLKIMSLCTGGCRGKENSFGEEKIQFVNIGKSPGDRNHPPNISHTLVHLLTASHDPCPPSSPPLRPQQSYAFPNNYSNPTIHATTILLPHTADPRLNPNGYLISRISRAACPIGVGRLPFVRLASL